MTNNELAAQPDAELQQALAVHADRIIKALITNPTTAALLNQPARHQHHVHEAAVRGQGSAQS